jgi:hemolysin D
VVPDGEPLVVQAMVQNRDVGFVHPGQEVEVKVETFTFTRYGLLHGIVESVTKDAVSGDRRKTSDQSGGDLDTGSRFGEAAGAPVYMARVRLDRQTIRVDDKDEPIGPGMAVTAEIKTGNRRVINYLLSPLQRYQNDALHER